MGNGILMTLALMAIFSALLMQTCTGHAQPCWQTRRESVAVACKCASEVGLWAAGTAPAVIEGKLEQCTAVAYTIMRRAGARAHPRTAFAQLHEYGGLVYNRWRTDRRRWIAHLPSPLATEPWYWPSDARCDFQEARNHIPCRRAFWPRWRASWARYLDHAETVSEGGAPEPCAGPSEHWGSTADERRPAVQRALRSGRWRRVVCGGPASAHLRRRDHFYAVRRPLPQQWADGGWRRAGRGR